MLIVLTCIVALYAIVILVFTIVFLKASYYKNDNTKPISEKISIIVAFRNEENNINNLLQSLLNQHYNGEYEIVLVNDHSEDKSIDLINNYLEDKISLYNLSDDLKGKKAALSYGISKAKGEILFFTDADCIVPVTWISYMLGYLKKKNIQMLCGPVKFQNSNKILEQIFALEFTSMTGSGAAGFYLKKPFMCNGANYAIYADIIKEASSVFSDNYSSGDDVFLLHAVSKTHNVDFIKSIGACVETFSPNSLHSFVNQRIRWVSKTKAYKNNFAVFMALLIYSTSFSIILIGLVSIFCNKTYLLFISIFLAKFIVELLFLIPVTKFYKQSKYLFHLPLIQIFYPFYILLIPLLSIVYKPKWKNRRIK